MRIERKSSQNFHRVALSQIETNCFLRCSSAHQPRLLENKTENEFQTLTARKTIFLKFKKTKHKIEANFNKDFTKKQVELKTSLKLSLHHIQTRSFYL